MQDEDEDEDEDEDHVGGAHRHQPLRYILGGDEPHPPWVPAPRATHIIPGHVPRDDGDNDHCPSACELKSAEHLERGRRV